MQDSPGAAALSTQYSTPRHLKRPARGDLLIFGSMTQRGVPDVGSSAITLPKGSHTTRCPPAAAGSSVGVFWKSMNGFSDGLSLTAPVRYCHASSSVPTFSLVICVSGEKRLPPSSPP